MILAFSTSCAWISFAAIDASRGLLWQSRDYAPFAASGACLKMLDQFVSELGLELADVEMFVADIGPGSFTGVRVGVTMAKTFGYLYDRPVAGKSSFDLISSDSTVVLPSKKGEFFIRRVGQKPIRSTALPDEPFLGFGPGIENQVWPDASRFQPIIDDLEPMAAVNFVPEYLIEPSISTPKIPYTVSEKAGG